MTSTIQGGRPRFLSDVIVELGFAEPETVEQAVRAARTPGTTVEQILVESGAITEEQLARAIAERHGIDYVDLGRYPLDGNAAALIAPAAARRYRAVPVGMVDGALLVALADPTAAFGLNDIAAMTGMEVRAAVASRSALEALLDALPLGEVVASVFPPEHLKPEPPADPLREELAAEAADLRVRVERLETELANALARRGELEERLAEAERTFEQLRALLSRMG